MKQKHLFKCTNCNYKSVKWLGKCPECTEWNSFTEEQPTLQNNQKTISPALKLTTLTEISSKQQQRIVAHNSEWDRVVGGGIMPGSFIILTGDPGIGKSTLLLQIAAQLAQHQKVFYFSSEESLEQVKLRAERIKALDKNLLFSDRAELESIIATAEQEKPDIIIIDSIQNCYFSQTQAIPGTLGQLREAGFRLMRLAKENTIAVIVTGHITKEGVIAGPKTLEHMVDAVFYLQGDDKWQTRILRSVKNRFGSINELGFFHMSETGLQEVANINEFLLQDYQTAPGSILISHIEGSRPLLIELQALTIPSKFGVPQRVITGVDHKHVMLIAAILEKYLQVKLSAHDIFFKVSGGLKIRESSADLGIALALLSSYFQQTLPEKSLALGEVNLTGHIKPINQAAIHLKEATNFGIKTILLAQNQSAKISGHAERFKHIYEILRLFDAQ
ncbi:TPA: DNA repair protein RadA [Candidatus Dependentiae bacterium]|nr:MAG: repair protein radA protein [candidate division TM6 bacterium GW2011_GWF2_36_131]KKQ02882.1 MAG: repair protein radA protein [candidate division TM6 bacterium GW2011_GWE2_36_25]HBR70247.1 DNA repair protein RadA [Candidatus Dependentiae bacterium]HCU00631.1 DNA repair protein RadA [Candidatus Dependentiae bacterium]